MAAARLGPGDAAPRWVGTLALLAFALFALRLVATRIVALRPQEATRVPAGLASRRLRSLCLLALRFVAGALLGVAHCLHTLGLLTLRLRTFRHFRSPTGLLALYHPLPPRLLLLRCLELLATRGFALVPGLGLLACTLLPRIVLSWCRRGALAVVVCARLALAWLRYGTRWLALALHLLDLRALRRARLRLRPVRRLAPGRRLGAARFLVALRTLFAPLAFALLCQRR